ncbi:Unknown protein [Striga hermonthica]|uniref:Histone chaperone domain-containing protein n=1 Tax=Striga hermonthica TaxID=68872 RepID=A0A9N7N4H0_STRHE|nr:Unknown protein [Striga hermonthica]
MAEKEGEKQEIEEQLELAICARLQHFKDQADSLTMESVRRLLEKDLGLEKLALDAHKRFIRQTLEKKISDGDECKSETPTEDADNDISKATVLPKQHEINPKTSSNGDEETNEGSPIMGVLSPKSEVATKGSSISEDSMKKAIWERADYFESNSGNITLAGVRRLLEQDLGLEKNALDPFKKFIGQQIDQVLNPPKQAKSVKDVKKKVSGNSKVKKSVTVSSEEESDSSDSENDEIEVKARPKKETDFKGKTKKVEQSKKRKLSKESDLRVSNKKQNKVAKRETEEENNSDEDGSLSEDGQSRSSVEKSVQRKEKAASGYGEKVENLKSIIKACGMSVAPSVYKKAKQVPEEEREGFIVKELEGILTREGLSKNPTEKEIKDCKKRKDRAKELEGIDMSNIISSSRRRSTFSFTPPVASATHAKKEKVDPKDTKKKEKVDKDNKDDNEQEDKKEEKNKAEEEEEETKEKDHEEDDEVEDVDNDDDDEEDDEEEEEEDESDEFNEDDDEDSD